MSTTKKSMNAFRVWIRSRANGSRVRVEGNENALWLIGRLSQSFVFKSSEPVRQDNDGVCCTFEVPYGSQNSSSTFVSLLRSIREVILTAEAV